jgi:hypothetical protein
MKALLERRQTRFDLRFIFIGDGYQYADPARPL